MLNDELVKFVEAARKLGIVQEMVIDGSFITDKANPDDVDIAVWTFANVSDDVDQMLQSEGVDMMHMIHAWFEKDRSAHEEWINFFTGKSGNQVKGIVRFQM